MWVKKQEPAQLRSLIRGQPVISYEDLDAARFSNRDFAEDILKNGWQRHGSVLPSIRPPITFDAANRSFSFHLHAWEPATFLLRAFDAYRDNRYFDACSHYAWDWFQQHQAKVMELDLAASLQFATEHTVTQAWYDMAVGQRVYRMAYLIDILARTDDCTDDKFARLWQGFLFHLELLSLDEFFKGHNNHGLYQALGQLAAARRFEYVPGFSRYKMIGLHRLAVMFDRSFFPSGAHREHSPDYHHMILGTLSGARRSGLIEPALDVVLERAESVESWMQAPNGALATIGDTDFKIRKQKNPSRGICAIPDAGYVFARIYAAAAPASHAAYLAQIAGFHSRTHKHADHLSMVWHDRGHEILIDPGRFSYASSKPPIDSEHFKQGFWYSDTRRIYVEKTRAHNCVEIDGLDYSRKGVKPFGSALLDAREEEGFVVTSCETRHFRSVRHWRGLVMKAGHFLLVLDWLHDALSTHEYRQWFHLAPEWEVASEAPGMRAVKGKEQIRIASLLSGGTFQPAVRGQTEPELLGWRSDKAESLVPSPCFSILQTENTAAFATLFVFGNVAEPDLGFSKVNQTFRKGRFGWCDDQGSHRLFFDRFSGQLHVTTKRGLKFW